MTAIHMHINIKVRKWSRSNKRVLTYESGLDLLVVLANIGVASLSGLANDEIKKKQFATEKNRPH